MDANLQVPASSFIGRRRELEVLDDWLDEGHRLITVLGPPGIGKTRLALECAARRSSRDANREACFADLTEARTTEDVAATVAEVLGAPTSHDMDAEAAVVHVGWALSARGALTFVVDNVEHVVSSMPDTLARWIADAPRAQVLVTSRELLRIEGERSLELRPLDLPGEDGGSPDDDEASEAVRLLLDRAQGYEPTAGDRPLLEDIVRSVEGIPLAIELAASRLAVLGPRQLLDRMPAHLEILSRGRRGAASRQATLRGAIDWSYQLLDPIEQLALARCSVFRGGFAPEVVEEVLCEAAAPAEGDASTPAPLDLLSALRDKSLLFSSTAADLPGETRLGMYESIREFASERLRELELEDTARLVHARVHARHAASWADTAHGPEGYRTLRRLALERDNLVAAFDALEELAPEDPAAVNARIDLLMAMEPLVATQGGFGRRVDALERTAEASARAPLDERVQAKIRVSRARALRMLGRTKTALDELSAARGLAKQVGDDALEGEILIELGTLHQIRGELDDAERDFARASELVPDDDSPDTARTRSRLEQAVGLLHHSRGRLSEARESYQRALVRSRGQGDRASEAAVHTLLGSVRLQQARLDEARAEYELALEVLRDLGDRRVLGTVLGNLGIVAQERGQLEEARERYTEALVHLRRIGDRPLEGHLLGYLAGLEHERGSHERARAHYEEALELLDQVGDRRQQGVFLAARGALDAQVGWIEASEEAFATASRLLEDVGDPGLLAALELHRGQLDLAESRMLFASGNADDAVSRRQSAQQRIHPFEGKDLDPRSQELLRASDDLRFALRMLRRSLEEGALVVAGDGSWFQLPDRARVDLSSRQALRRVLSHLARARRDRPGRAVPGEDLLEYGWPGERMLPEAGSNRLRVALSGLRKLGLRDLLKRTDEGYLLDPALPIVLIEAVD